MAVIVPEIEFLGLLVWVGFCGRSFVLIIVMTKVLRGFVLLVPAILGYRGPGYLEREQAQEEKQKKATHGQHGNRYDPVQAMTTIGIVGA